MQPVMNFLSALIFLVGGAFSLLAVSILIQFVKGAI